MCWRHETLETSRRHWRDTLCQIYDRSFIHWIYQKSSNVASTEDFTDRANIIRKKIIRYVRLKESEVYMPSLMMMIVLFIYLYVASFHTVLTFLVSCNYSTHCMCVMRAVSTMIFTKPRCPETLFNDVLFHSTRRKIIFIKKQFSHRFSKVVNNIRDWFKNLLEYEIEM